MTMKERVTGQSLYEEHVREVVEGDGVQMPPWERIPEWERENWEELARDQDSRHGSNH